LFEDLTHILLNLIWSLGYGGVFIVMLLAGFCAPIPWELVLIPIAASNLDPIAISFVSGLGSSSGAVLGYWFGKRLGRPLILKYGRYLSIDRPDLEKAERWITKWGSLATIVCRSVQYLPYKTFNVAAGILKINFLYYVMLTIVGSIIRCLSLVYVGKILSINQITLMSATLAALAIGCLLFISEYVTYYRRVKKN